MRHISTRRSGFTLLELLVVIFIIGILVALLSAAYSVAQQRGRNARRRGDMKAVQNAMEQYYAVNTAYVTPLAGAMKPNYLPSGAPSDPKPAPHLGYQWSVAADKYCLCASLEGEIGNATNNPSDGTCNYTSGSGTLYCVSNLQ